MISRIDGPRKMRDFLVYDGEWVPHRMDLRCWGVFDGERYRWYRTSRGFLEGEMTSRNRGKWFYAHYGGMADIQFLIKELRDMGFTVKGSFAGSSAIIVRITKGKNSWHLIDSFYLLKAKLADVAEAIGMRKTGPKELDEDATEEDVASWYANVALPELVDYNENDCRILWKAIDQFENELLGLGGQLQMTLASCAMNLFRRRYLKHPVETSAAVNESCSETYCASRVEVVKRQGKRLRFYDYNSSFPWSMTQPLPGSLRATLRGLPDSIMNHAQGTLYASDVEIEVPESYLPPLPLRRNGRIFFPHGRWRSTFTDVDIELLLAEGGKILKVHETLVFEPFHDLSDYANDLYERKAAAKDGGMARDVYKLLLNGLYGKFAEGISKSTLFVNPGPDRLEMLRATPEREMETYVMPGVYIDDVEVDVPHRHVMISSTITARSRRLLYDGASMAYKGPYYFDTDGFAVDPDCPFTVGRKLGELKMEAKCGWREGPEHVKECGHEKHVEAGPDSCFFKDGYFVAPKVYQAGNVVKGKGFSLSRATRWRGRDENGVPVHRHGIVEDERSAFHHLIEGAELEVMRMRRLKENLRAGNLKPEEHPMWKGLSPKGFPKRFMFPDGHTRPWHVSELEEAS